MAALAPDRGVTGPYGGNIVITRKPNLEWEFLAEEDQDKPWPPIAQDRVERPETDRRQSIRRVTLFGIIMVFFLAAGIGGVYARQTALQGIQEVEQEVLAAVDTEQWVQHNAPQLTADVMTDNDASSYLAWVVQREQLLLAMNSNNAAPDVRIKDVRYANGVAAADLTLTQPVDKEGAPVTYRQTRFYRETEEGWLRTKPDPALWGAPLTLETDHLIWYYRQRDHDVIAEITAQTDALYLGLERDYGLRESAAGDKLVIDVQVDYLPGLISLLSRPTDPIIVSSPSVYLVPVERTEAEIIVQTIAIALVKEMWEQAYVQHDIQQSNTLLAGVNLWLLWDMGLGLSEWKDDVVQWVFAGEILADDDYTVILPARYHQLCAAFRSWMIPPSTTGIPLYCDSADSSRWRNLLLPSLHQASLVSLDGTYPYYHPDLGTIRIENPLMMSSVIDYAVIEYGRDRLPDLVAALGQHDSLESLMPAVYGVSLDEFEQGWKQHVANMVR